MANDRKQGKASAKPDAERRRMERAGQDSGAARDESISVGGSMGTGKNTNQPRPQTHKKSLSLQIEAVRNRKALLRQELDLLDSQEQQLMETLQAYEENTSNLST